MQEKNMRSLYHKVNTVGGKEKPVRSLPGQLRDGHASEQEGLGVTNRRVRGSKIGVIKPDSRTQQHQNDQRSTPPQTPFQAAFCWLNPHHLALGAVAGDIGCSSNTRVPIGMDRTFLR